MWDKRISKYTEADKSVDKSTLSLNTKIKIPTLDIMKKWQKIMDGKWWTRT